MAGTPREETIMQYPQIEKCQSVAELSSTVEKCVIKLSPSGDTVNLPSWPGQWGVVANALRWKSCKHEGRESENLLLLANILMDGAAHYSRLYAEEKKTQKEMVDRAATFLDGWIKGVNSQIFEDRAAAEELDQLSGMAIAINWARHTGGGMAQFTAMRAAISRVGGIYLAGQDAPHVITGERLKTITCSSDIDEAVKCTGARRL